MKKWPTSLRRLIFLASTAISAVLKTIIGNPIHILDALAKPVQALSVKLEPIQDLHGYDNPWPSGGGKNKLQNKGTSGSSNGITWMMNADGSITLSGTASAATFITINSYSDRQFLTTGPVTLICSADASYNPNINGLNFQNDIYADGVYAGTIQKNNTTRNISGDVVEVDMSRLSIAADTVIPSGTIFYPAIEIGNTISATWTPYSNICPISGHTDADVTRTGKNLLRLVESEMISSGWNRAFPISVKVGTYIISCQNDFGVGTAFGVKVSFVDESNTVIKDLTKSYNFGQRGYHVGRAATITAEEASRIKGILFQFRASGATYNDLAQGNLQLERGSTATAYSPYVGTTYPIPLGQTVYGGTLDVTTGKLTVDRAMVDLGTLTWGKTSSTQGIAMMVSYPTGITTGVIGVNSLACSAYNAIPCINAGIATDAMLPNGSICQSVGGASIRARDDNYTDEASFKAAVSGVQLVYELATPIVYDLTPTEVTLLLGENNLWSDGEMTLVYLADGNASDEEALNILLGGRYVNNHEADEPTDREALDILLGRGK